MKIGTTTKLAVRIDTPDSEKPINQTLNRVTNGASEAQIVAVGEALTQFSETAALSSVVETIQNEYVK
ncbi:hypothetical protein A5886_002467 [Enterococcus sp. 8G7_MSG3316]|uniref:DUF1659 domain-containing protein n=1 Tax=Candidatus Enterococcus testudinis TaxID=1834191 RepID=A0A242A8I9_9ENTE|nr:hypothetical protein [Enterococcus sp. 8G7_MSG3316]OTN77367.1 hypothetical protein A5886_002467 [Enterococcus sp. 8G7_MSG3316]